jgi:hypothetical protein
VESRWDGNIFDQQNSRKEEIVPSGSLFKCRFGAEVAAFFQRSQKSVWLSIKMPNTPVVTAFV